MKEEARRKIAFAAAAAAGARGSSIYSYTAGGHTNMGGSDGSYYDHDSGSHFSDTYDYGSGSHWSINIQGESFSGYHYGSGDHFSGTVCDGCVQLYDYGDGSWHNYQV